VEREFGDDDDENGEDEESEDEDDSLLPTCADVRFSLPVTC